MTTLESSGGDEDRDVLGDDEGEQLEEDEDEVEQDAEEDEEDEAPLASSSADGPIVDIPSGIGWWGCLATPVSTLL